MTNTEQAYSTDNPEAVAAYRKIVADMAAFGERIREDCAALGGNKGALIRRGIWGSPDRIVGLEPDGSGQIPPGWRVVRERLEPRRGKPGEDARRWLEDHQPPDVRHGMVEHGLPRHSSVPTETGYRIDQENACTWTPRKLSEFHAAREAFEAAEASATTAA